MYRISNWLSDSAQVFPQFLGIAILCVGAATPSWAQSLPPSPIPATETLAHFALHPDCRIELVAAEPDVIDPVAIAFAPDGRLWVVEYSDYPNGPAEHGPPLSRIRTLTDADGDGRYTDPVTFADKLLFANGLMLWQDGVIVTTNGGVVFLRDTDGDGRADEQTEWFRGFATENPQLRANHPTLGLDGHIYVASGLRGGEVIAVREDWAREAKPVSLSGRDFRFNPVTGKYESVSGPGQFGLCFDPFGNRFVCSNRNPCNHIVLEDRYLARNPFLAVSKVHEDVSPSAENSRLYPISRTWTTSNLHANQFTAACGLKIYGGDALPDFRGNSFTCEPTGNLVHRDVLEARGATFTSTYGREGVEFLASRDEWFRPVNLAHGPDGALYVVDMYRAVIEHPQFMPDELKTRPDLTLGNDRGRIYRIVQNTPVERAHDASFRTDAKSLVAHLASPNAWHRETAFRLLLENQELLDVPALVTLCDPASSSSPETVAVSLALLTASGSLTPAVAQQILTSGDPRVVALQFRLLDQRADDEAARTALPDEVRTGFLLARLQSSDVPPQLAFQAALSIGGFKPTEAIIAALGRVAAAYHDDVWFRAAVASSSSGHEADLFLSALDPIREGMLHQRDAVATGRLPLELTRQYVTMVGARGETDGATRILQQVVQPLATEEALPLGQWQRLQFACMRALHDGLRRGKSSLAQVVAALSPADRAAVDDLFAAARRLAVDESQAAVERREALAVVSIDPAEEAAALLRQLVSSESDQAVLIDAIAGLGGTSQAAVADILLEGFRGRTPSVRLAILQALLQRGDRITRLLDAIEAGDLSPRDIDAVTASRLTKSGDATIRERSTRLLAAAVDADRVKLIAAYQPCLTQPGDPRRGIAIFKKICATCHKVGDVGTNVGPDISDSRTKTPEFLLTNILDPNRAVDGNYFGYTILDVEGRVHTGIITAETASSVTLRLPEGKEVTLLRQEIEAMTNTGLSLMPVGVEKDITVEQMADLISFVKNWRYLDGSVPEEVIGR